MSGSYRISSYSDEEAMQWFLGHALTSVLANESSNALVLLLELPRELEPQSPYVQLYYEDAENRIRQRPLTHLVLKMTPLGEPVDMLVENQVIRVADHASWQHEIHLQKYIFHKTFMMDMQIRAICPNVLCSWKVAPSRIPEFGNLVTIRSGQPKRKFAHWDVGERIERVRLDPSWVERSTTHVQNVFTFFQEVYKRNLDIGCMFMEYLTDARDMVEYACFNRENVSEKYPLDAWGTWEEYTEYLYGKAYGLIEYDKLGAIGVRHNDMHPGNMVTYRTPDHKLVTAIIDFGLSTTHVGSTCRDMRPRSFNDLERDTAPYAPWSYNQRRSFSYLSNCVLNERDRVSEWNDVKRVLSQRCSKNSYKFVPVDLMNEIDASMRERGRRIRDFLMDTVNVSDVMDGQDLIRLYLRLYPLDENCMSLLDPTVAVCVRFDKVNRRRARRSIGFNSRIQRSVRRSVKR